MRSKDEGVLDKIDRYYTGRLKEHGATPRGVDWNSTEAQEQRFSQLFKLLDTEAPLILDYGCGYGAFADFLLARLPSAKYVGYDVSAAMIDAARENHRDSPRCTFTNEYGSIDECDFVVASGIFSVKMDVETTAWEAYIEDTIRAMSRLARTAFAFNLLTAYSDPERMRPDLFYADPHRYFDYVRTHFSRNVALLHDYGLYEFTLHVRL